MIITKTTYGTKLSLSHTTKFVQNPLLLQKIWNNPEEYKNIVDVNEIQTNNQLADTYLIDFDFNRALPVIDPAKTLSFVSDCTKKNCIYNRFKYRTRDVVLKYFVQTLMDKKITKFNILFLSSYRLLSELFYLTELIKKGYFIGEIHLLDQTYSKFLLTIDQLDIIDMKFLSENKLGWLFYQFLEYFYANNYPISIYIYANPIIMGKNNMDRIDITISVDTEMEGITDYLSMLAINLVSHSNTINLESYYYKHSTMKLFKYKVCIIFLYCFTPIDKEKLLVSVAAVDKLKTLPEIIMYNSLLNTVYHDRIKNYIDYKIYNKKSYNNMNFYFSLVLILFIGCFIYFLIINKEIFGPKLFWILVIIFIVFLIYYLRIFINTKPLHILKI